MDVANRDRRVRRRHRRPVRGGARLDDVQRRPHVDVPRQRRGAEDARALPRVVGGRRACSTASRRRILHDIVDTPITPELLPLQGRQARPEDRGHRRTVRAARLLPVPRRSQRRPAGQGVRPRPARLRRSDEGRGYDDATILRWLEVFHRRFFSQQFKRSSMPDGPKVGSVALSPRGDWRMPSDAAASLWARRNSRARDAPRSDPGLTAG